MNDHKVRINWLLRRIRFGRDPLSMAHRAILVEVSRMLTDRHQRDAGELILHVLCVLYRFPTDPDEDRPGVAA